MSGTRIRSRANFKPLLKELHELERLPTPEVSARLDALLGKAFEETQRHVHVNTGVLKASGEQSTSEYGPEWRGRITYGKGAYYAGIEFNRGAGPTSHNPFHHLGEYEDEFEHVIGEAIRDA